MLVKDCKVWIKKVDPIFLHPIFDNDKKVTEDVLSQLEEKHKTLVNCLYVCYRCGGNNICSAYKHVRSADERTAAFNECLDFHKKWRDEWNQMLTPSSHARCVLHLLFRYKKTFFSQKELVMFQIWEKVLWALMCQKRLGMLKTIMAEAQLKGIYLKPFMEWVVATVLPREVWKLASAIKEKDAALQDCDNQIQPIQYENVALQAQRDVYQTQLQRYQDTITHLRARYVDHAKDNITRQRQHHHNCKETHNFCEW